MFEAIEQLTREETELRHSKLKKLFGTKNPNASGMLIFSSLNIYYLTGIFTNGVLYIPMNGEPALMIRKGIERAKLETSLTNIMPFRSYSDITNILVDLNIPLGDTVGVEMGGITWATSNLLKSKIQGIEFTDITGLINKARAVKTDYELKKLRIAGQLHLESYEALAQKIRPLMTEREISVLTFEEFLKRGHAGLVRQTNLGGENVLGQLAVGDNSNYPVVRDSPAGSIGGHPCTPYLGSNAKWEKNSLLLVDLGFSYQGYITDKTQTYWAGSKNSVPDAIKKAYDICVEIHDRTAAALVPGATPEEIWQLSLEIAKKAGMAENYMGTGGNQVKFLGHGIGLTLDEYPPIANKFTDPFEAGMLIALEPKMGFKGIGMVGIENVFEIKDDSGAKSITGTDTDLICIE